MEIKTCKAQRNILRWMNEENSVMQGAAAHTCMRKFQHLPLFSWRNHLQKSTLQEVEQRRHPAPGIYGNLWLKSMRMIPTSEDQMLPWRQRLENSSSLIAFLKVKNKNNGLQIIEDDDANPWPTWTLYGVGVQEPVSVGRGHSLAMWVRKFYYFILRICISQDNCSNK